MINATLLLISIMSSQRVDAREIALGYFVFSTLARMMTILDQIGAGAYGSPPPVAVGGSGMSDLIALLRARATARLAEYPGADVANFVEWQAADRIKADAEIISVMTNDLVVLSERIEALETALRDAIEAAMEHGAFSSVRLFEARRALGTNS